jgi:CRP/FNR family transcriptional regulator
MYEELKYWYLRDHKLFWTLSMSQIKQLCIITGFKKANKGDVIYFSSSDVPRVFYLKKATSKLSLLMKTATKPSKTSSKKAICLGNSN